MINSVKKFLFCHPELAKDLKNFKKLDSPPCSDK